MADISASRDQVSDSILRKREVIECRVKLHQQAIKNRPPKISRGAANRYQCLSGNEAVTADSFGDRLDLGTPRIVGSRPNHENVGARSKELIQRSDELPQSNVVVSNLSSVEQYEVDPSVSIGQIGC